MKKLKQPFLVCPQCGKTDQGVHSGTRIDMICHDCSNGAKNKYGALLVGLCRNCCPTGHGTHGENES